jgi:hypothetical protein
MINMGRKPDYNPQVRASTRASRRLRSPHSAARGGRRIGSANVPASVPTVHQGRPQVRTHLHVRWQVSAVRERGAGGDSHVRCRVLSGRAGCTTSTCSWTARSGATRERFESDGDVKMSRELSSAGRGSWCSLAIALAAEGSAIDPATSHPWSHRSKPYNRLSSSHSSAPAVAPRKACACACSFCHTFRLPDTAGKSVGTEWKTLEPKPGKSLGVASTNA